MNDFKLLPDDPKLTAYALGELEGDERAVVEHALRNDPMARTRVEEIRTMAAQLETVFEMEPVIAVRAARDAADPYGAAARRKSERFPQIYFLIGALAAACLVAVLALQDPPIRNAPQKTYYEVVMSPLEPALAETEAGIDSANRPESELLAANAHPVSTFSAEVDPTSYAKVRRFIQKGRLPPVDAVRIEEMLNYFPYSYVAPRSDGSDGNLAPFAATMEVADAPWAPGHRLVRIGLKAREVTAASRGSANLVFLLDVSGSMNGSGKLPLVQESLRLLLARLNADDRVAIVTYAGASGLVLPSTPVAKAREIVAALDELDLSGSTKGAAGVQLAYNIAKENFVNGGINRVILCTDGGFNGDVMDDGGLVRLVEGGAKSGVPLTVLGFGLGNLNGAAMQQLAAHGNGNYGHVNSRREAEKLLVQQVNGPLETVAKDVKLQVEFNPAKVASYRLIGYEKRTLKEEDFSNDTVDAGEIGAGHTVTALYEIVPVAELRAGSELRAESLELRARSKFTGELLTLKVRYTEPAGELSKTLEFPLVDRGGGFAEASDDFKFAAAVAGFGMILRDSPHKGVATHASVKRWAEAGSANDLGGYRAEFIELVRRAEAL
jgi:Ca-activated chloride channel family protein